MLLLDEKINFRLNFIKQWKNAIIKDSGKVYLLKIDPRLYSIKYCHGIAYYEERISNYELAIYAYRQQIKELEKELKQNV